MHRSIESAVMRPDTGGNSSPDSPWHTVVGQLLKFLLVVNWDEIPGEEEVLEREISQALEKCQETVSFQTMGLKG